MSLRRALAPSLTMGPLMLTNIIHDKARAPSPTDIVTYKGTPMPTNHAHMTIRTTPSHYITQGNFYINIFKLLDCMILIIVNR